MKITRLAYQKKDPNRVNVYVDEKFAVGLEVNDVVKLGLYKNQEISQQQLNKIIGESEFGKKLNAALNFLSFRPRSEFELRQFFRRKKFTDIEPVVEKLKLLGQINDEEFARWYIEQRQTFRPKGHRAIQAELQSKGIKIKVASGVSEEAMARKALTRYHGKKIPAKMQQFLARRGFDWETIEKVVQ